MTVKEMINILLEYPMNSDIIIKKELAYNIWVNTDIKILDNETTPIITFDFPAQNFEIRKKG